MLDARRSMIAALIGCVVAILLILGLVLWFYSDLCLLLAQTQSMFSLRTIHGAFCLHLYITTSPKQNWVPISHDFPWDS